MAALQASHQQALEIQKESLEATHKTDTENHDISHQKALEDQKVWLEAAHKVEKLALDINHQQALESQKASLEAAHKVEKLALDINHQQALKNQKASLEAGYRRNLDIQKSWLKDCYQREFENQTALLRSNHSSEVRQLRKEMESSSGLLKDEISLLEYELFREKSYAKRVQEDLEVQNTEMDNAKRRLTVQKHHLQVERDQCRDILRNLKHSIDAWFALNEDRLPNHIWSDFLLRFDGAYGIDTSATSINVSAWAVMTPWVEGKFQGTLDPVDMSPWARVARLHYLSHCLDDGEYPVSLWVHILDSIAMISRDVKRGLIAHFHVLHDIMQEMRPRLLHGLSPCASSFIEFALQELAFLMGINEIIDWSGKSEGSEQLFLNKLDVSIRARGRYAVEGICGDLSQDYDCITKGNLVIFSDKRDSINVIVVDLIERSVRLVNSCCAAPIKDPFQLTLLSPDPSRWPNEVVRLGSYDSRFRQGWKRIIMRNAQGKTPEGLDEPIGRKWERTKLAMAELLSLPLRPMQCQTPRSYV